MEKKYELTNATIEIDGHVLHRIKALRTFRYAKEGDLGGFVESEDNLSHSGECWVRHNAKVYGEAKVLDGSIVQDCAQVYGEAKIINESTVQGHAQVFGHAIVSGSSWISNKSKVYDDAEVYNSSISDEAQVFGRALVSYRSDICSKAKVYDSATVQNSHVSWTSEVCGVAYVSNAEITRDAIVKYDDDYIVFKNNFSSNRFFTWTRSNNKWTVGCFYGTGEELVKKAFADNKHKGEAYKAYVDLVNRLLEIEKDLKESHELISRHDIKKYMKCSEFDSNWSPVRGRDREQYGNGYFYINSKWKQEIDKKGGLPKYEIVTWPEIQNYMHCEGFDKNCSLANSDADVEQYGSSAYYVNSEWKQKMDEQNETGF